MLSRDPQLSIERHADPSYVNSSDPTDISSFDNYHLTPIASSPPPVDDITDEDTDVDEDEPTITAVRVPSSILAARQRSHLTLNQKINDFFDTENKRELYLDNEGLTELPNQLKDLSCLVDFQQHNFRMDFSSNNLKLVNRFLFDILQIRHLNLSNNSLTEISPLIVKLQNLVSLNLSRNKLKWLPSTLLAMPKLTDLTTFPNEFGDGVRYFLRVPTLQELAKREILAHENEFAMFCLPDDLVFANECGRCCTVCFKLFVEPVLVDVSIRKVEGGRSGERVPFVSQYCSVACARTKMGV